MNDPLKTLADMTGFDLKSMCWYVEPTALEEAIPGLPMALFRFFEIESKRKAVALAFDQEAA